MIWIRIKTSLSILFLFLVSLVGIIIPQVFDVLCKAINNTLIESRKESKLEKMKKKYKVKNEKNT